MPPEAAYVAPNSTDTCGGSFTLASDGTYRIEVDTPFSAKARFTIALSTPVTKSVALDEERRIEVRRIGQDALFSVRLPSGMPASVSARDVTPGSKGNSFRLNAFRRDGTQISSIGGSRERGASLYFANGGDYTFVVEPANGSTGIFAVAARSSPRTTVDGSPVELKANDASEVVWMEVTARAGENVAVTMDGVANPPNVESSSRLTLLAADGSELGAANCFAHAADGRPRPWCQFFVDNLPADGSYAVRLTPPVGASVSGRVVAAHVFSHAIVPGTPVAIGPMKTGQVARYTFNAAIRQQIAVRLSNISTLPAGRPVYVFLQRYHAPGMNASAEAKSESVAIPPQVVTSAGTYVVTVDPAAASLQFAQLSVVVREMAAQTR